MNHGSPFSLRIFVAEGDPDGLRDDRRNPCGADLDRPAGSPHDGEVGRFDAPDNDGKRTT